uniref:Uncharacterized protein n=1 Tax=Anguilla anguilla TaxID=7936 RepID=A0A0E9XJZ1_ANGAN
MHTQNNVPKYTIVMAVYPLRCRYVQMTAKPEID